MVPKTTEDRVSQNETDIAVLTRSCEDCKGMMEEGLKRVEKNQERSDKRMTALLVAAYGILGAVFAALLTLVLK